MNFDWFSLQRLMKLLMVKFQLEELFFQVKRQLILALKGHSENHSRHWNFRLEKIL